MTDSPHILTPGFILGLLSLFAPVLMACSTSAAPTLSPNPAPSRSTATPIPVSTATPDAFVFLKPAGDQPGVPTSSLAGKESRLAVILDNEWVFIKNGGMVNLEKGLVVELFLDPYPPTKLTAWLDIYLTRGDKPVTNAGVDIVYDMLGMAHGPFLFPAKNLGDGHYLVAIDYIMFAVWEHKLTIYLPEDHYDLMVGTIIFPAAVP